LHQQIISPSEIRAYIAHAREFTPCIPHDLADYVSNSYAEMRQDEVQAGSLAASYTTARTLLSIIRMSEALARLRWVDVVSNESSLPSSTFFFEC